MNYAEHIEIDPSKRFGNASNLKIAHKLLSNADVIADFTNSGNGEVAFLEMH
jgi:hypothetical protein